MRSGGSLTGLRVFGVAALAHTVYAFTSFIVLPGQAPAELSDLSRYTPCLGTVIAAGGCLVAFVGAFTASQHRRR